MSAEPSDLNALMRREQAAVQDRLMMTSAKGYELQLRRIGQSESPEHPVNQFLADLDRLRAIEARAQALAMFTAHDTELAVAVAAAREILGEDG